MLDMEAQMAAVLARIGFLLIVAVYSTQGGCTFPESWSGSWFQSGLPNLIHINSTHIQSKGECQQTEGLDKFLLNDRSDDSVVCMVIHEKHKYVLQYKETYCSPKDSLSSCCDLISGDAPLYSMFRKSPRPTPQPCPFRPPPFTFTYNRGSGECSNPPSRAESCTDDSRLLLRYMACPDVPATESNVEELVCLATWKEGSTRYLVGQVSQPHRRNAIPSDEDTYRCFIYRGVHGDKVTTYDIAQSADATCNGLSSPTDGSRTIKLTNSDEEHTRCKFPEWIVSHHKWLSLDHTHQYHFTTRNATLKIMNIEGSFEEKRLLCHSILEYKEKKHITLIAHLTKGCESGHVCVRVWKRADGVLEMQQGVTLWDAPLDACHAPNMAPIVTLITTSLAPARCPLSGRYSVIDAYAMHRRKRQQSNMGSMDTEVGVPACDSEAVQSASVACNTQQDTIEFQSGCSNTVYTCAGGWSEGSLGYIVAAPVSRSARPPAVCFVYTHHANNESRLHSAPYLSLSMVPHSCARGIVPGLHGERAYNLTINGTCEQSSKYSFAPNQTPTAAILITSLLLTSLVFR